MCGKYPDGPEGGYTMDDKAESIIQSGCSENGGTGKPLQPDLINALHPMNVEIASLREKLAAAEQRAKSMGEALSAASVQLHDANTARDLALANAARMGGVLKKIRRSDLQDRDQPFWDEIQAALALAPKVVMRGWLSHHPGSDHGVITPTRPSLDAGEVAEQGLFIATGDTHDL